MLEGRAWVVYQWLKVLQEVNCHYQYDDDLPEFDEVKARCSVLMKLLSSDAEFVNDESVLRETEIAKDDARHIRTTVVIENDVDDMEVEEWMEACRLSHEVFVYNISTKEALERIADRDYLRECSRGIGC